MRIRYALACECCSSRVVMQMVGKSNYFVGPGVISLQRECVRAALKRVELRMLARTLARCTLDGFHLALHISMRAAGAAKSSLYGEPGIHGTTELVEKWIPGSLCARPGVTAGYGATSSTRRLSARPASVAFEPTGASRPTPAVRSRVGVMRKLFTSSAATASARRFERSRLYS